MALADLARLPSECKVCHALDTLPDDLATKLDQGLESHGPNAIAKWLTANGYPVSRKSVGRHIGGQCSLGLDYRKIPA